MRRAASTLGLVILGPLSAGCAGETATEAPAPIKTATPPSPPPPTPDGPASPRPERFRWTGNEAACPAQAEGDCVSAIELGSDGAVTLDPWGAPGTAPLASKLGPKELERAAATLTAAELLLLLDQKPVCSGANETETMMVDVDGAVHRNATGYCNDAPLQAVRKVLLDLSAAHFPDHHLISPPF
jgi:hypothetical protein